MDRIQELSNQWRWQRVPLVADRWKRFPSASDAPGEHAETRTREIVLGLQNGNYYFILSSLLHSFGTLRGQGSSSLLVRYRYDKHTTLKRDPSPDRHSDHPLD